jgi:hypothetical protein
MGGLFHDAPYTKLDFNAFGPVQQYRVEVRNAGKTIVIGDHTDVGFQLTSTLVQPGPDAVDVVIHGLPGRFVVKLGGGHEIPVPIVAQLLESVGIKRGVELRLLKCHATEAPLNGSTVAQLLATEWKGIVTGPNGLLRIQKGPMRIDLVDWEPDPVLGGMSPNVTGQSQGNWISYKL